MHPIGSATKFGGSVGSVIESLIVLAHSKFVSVIQMCCNWVAIARLASCGERQAGLTRSLPNLPYSCVPACSLLRFVPHLRFLVL